MEEVPLCKHLLLPSPRDYCLAWPDAWHLGSLEPNVARLYRASEPVLGGHVTLRLCE